MRVIVNTCLAVVIMISYSIVYRFLRGLTVVVTFILYRDKRAVLVEKRDEYFKKISRTDEQVVQWASESWENLFIMLFICSLSSVAIVGYIVFKLVEVTR